MLWLLPKKTKWDKAAVIEESKKYTSAEDFRKANFYVYGVTAKNGWLDKMPWLYPLFAAIDNE